jgi:hypothetical protein
MEICKKLGDIAFGATFVLGKAMMKHNSSEEGVRIDFGDGWQHIEASAEIIH